MCKDAVCDEKAPQEVGERGVGQRTNFVLELMPKYLKSYDRKTQKYMYYCWFNYLIKLSQVW
jgi:hypothetical protein